MGRIIPNSSSGAFSGSTLVLNGKIAENVNDLGTQNVDDTVVNIDINLGGYFKIIIAADTEFTFSNFVVDKFIGITFEISNGGGYAITWPSSVIWPSGIAPVLSNVGVDVLMFYSLDGGTTIYGGVSMEDVS